MKKASLRIFDYAKAHPQEILAVTDAGEEILYGELNDLSAKLNRIVGHRLVFVLCRNTPGSFLGYLGLLNSGGVSLLLDADIAPALLQDLVHTYHPAFFLLPEDLEPKSLQACFLNTTYTAGQEYTPLEERRNPQAERPEKTQPERRNPQAEGPEKIQPEGRNPQAERPEKTRTEKGKLQAERQEKTQPERRNPQAEGCTAEELLKIHDYRLLYRAPQGEESEDPILDPELRLLLTTSGSTGSSKLVRISGENLDANTASIIDYLKITKEDRPITVLPMQYSYGMSIINTHVMAGATILLTKHTLMEKRFWERAQEEKCTSLCGVPYTFEMYSRLGLMKMDFPSLKTVTQAGGKLSEKRHMQFAQWAAEKGIRFYVMYGQTEASPRMGFLPPEKAIEKCGSMGIAIPGGKIELIDGNGNVIEENRPFEKAGVDDAEDLSPVGELVYRGPNVALGYAVCAEDLAKGDEFHGVLHTGDMARRDADGYFYIVGRQSRFIKIGGKRIGLDEVEKILRIAFPELDIACAGKDEELHVFAAIPGEGGREKRTGTTTAAAAGTDTRQLTEEIDACLDKMIGVPERRIRVFLIPEIPRNSSGKIQYNILRQG